MNPLGLVGAVVGGVVGALLWGIFTYFSGWEVGYLAWGIGGLVGFGCLCLGGRGRAMATVCAVVALLSIIGGKFFATHMAVGEAIDKATRNLHKEMVADAKDFARIESELEYPEFMLAHGYTDTDAAGEIRPEELAYFKEYSAPLLRELSASPDYATWSESEYASNYRESMTAALSVRKLVFDGLGPVDLVFFLLGVVTAFQMTQGESPAQQEQEAPARTQVAAAPRKTALDEERDEEKEAQPQV